MNFLNINSFKYFSFLRENYTIKSNSGIKFSGQGYLYQINRKIRGKLSIAALQMTITI